MNGLTRTQTTAPVTPAEHDCVVISFFDSLPPRQQAAIRNRAAATVLDTTLPSIADEKTEPSGTTPARSAPPPAYAPRVTGGRGVISPGLTRLFGDSVQPVKLTLADSYTARFKYDQISALANNMKNGDQTLATLEHAAQFILRMAPCTSREQRTQFEKTLLAQTQYLPQIVDAFFSINWVERLAIGGAASADERAKLKEVWQTAIESSLELWPFCFPVTNPVLLRHLDDKHLALVIRATWDAVVRPDSAIDRAWFLRRSTFEARAQAKQLTALESRNVARCDKIFYGLMAAIKSWDRKARPLPPTVERICTAYFRATDNIEDDLTDLKNLVD